MKWKKKAKSKKKVKFTSLKNKVESLLFSSGRRMNKEEIANLCKSNTDEVKEVLKELKDHYKENESSLMVVEEGEFWKITVKEEFLPLVRKIITKTELDKGTLETLAVIAFKYPVLQSDVIKIRTNKAYDHMSNLEELGYILRQKHGRTRLIKLTQKFFEYFDLPEEKLKEAFKDFGGLARAIEKKEEEIEHIKEEQKQKAGELKSQTEVDLIDKKGRKKQLKVYGIQEPKEEITPITDKLGELEIVDEQSEEAEQEPEIIEETAQPDPNSFDKAAKPDEETELEKELEREIDTRVEEILHPKKEDFDKKLPEPTEGLGLEISAEQKESKDTLGLEKPTQKKSDKSDEPKDLLEDLGESNKENNEEK